MKEGPLNMQVWTQTQPSEMHKYFQEVYDKNKQTKNSSLLTVIQMPRTRMNTYIMEQEKWTKHCCKQEWGPFLSITKRSQYHEKRIQYVPLNFQWLHHATKWDLGGWVAATTWDLLQVWPLSNRGAADLLTPPSECNSISVFISWKFHYLTLCMLVCMNIKLEL